MPKPARMPAWIPGKNPERLGAKYVINRTSVLARTTLSEETFDALVKRGVIPTVKLDYAPNIVLVDCAVLDDFFAWAAENYKPSGAPGRSVVEDLSAFKAAR